MEKDIKLQFAGKIADFRLPRYHELPNVGLYLEQVTKYVNGYIVPLGCQEITTSMISNYVKKGVIAAPVKKQYYADQIAYLLFVSVGKSVLSMENIAQLFVMQKAVYSAETAYNYFCEEFENMLEFVCGQKETLDEIGTTQTTAKTMLRSVLFAASHTIFVNNCFEVMKSANPDAGRK